MNLTDIMSLHVCVFYVFYDKMSEKHGEMCERIIQLKTELEKPLSEIEAIEEQLTDLFL